MSPAETFAITFWGVRGSIPTPGRAFAGFGGHTSCIELRCLDRLFILDAGTGLKPLGEKLSADHPRGGISADLFLTHFHLDHIHGMPFFGPLYNGTNRFRIWAGHLAAEQPVREALKRFMQSPILPMPIDSFIGLEAFHDFDAGATLQPYPGITLRTHRLNHPGSATAYRFECNDRAVCYVTDFEPDEGPHDDALMAFIAGADVAIMDATFDIGDYESKRGWGHGSWQTALALCRRAGVRHPKLSHHAPEHDDATIERFITAVGSEDAPHLFTREGETVMI